MANRYSVYHKKDEMPLVIYASAKVCAEAMKIKENSFYRAISRMKNGKYVTRKWIICRDATSIKSTNSMKEVL